MNGAIIALGESILKKSAEEIGKQVLKAAVIGGISDGVITLLGKEEKSLPKEVACGATSSAAGAATTILVQENFRRFGPTGLLLGAGASVITRYGFRKAFPDK